MKIIKFRGKRVDNSEWVYGTTLHHNHRYILNDYYANEYHDWIEIIPATIGQFTGLTDKNGTEIYEGDKVKFIDVNSSPIPFSESVNEVFWWNEFSCFSLKNTQSDLTYLTDCEVIGNIHETQEDINQWKPNHSTQSQNTTM